MSWKASGHIKGLTENLTRSEKFLLLILADYYNEETHQCDPSISRLAAEALMSPRHAIRTLQRLEEKGFLHICRRSEDGAHQTNQYDLLCLGVTPCQGVTQLCQGVLTSDVTLTVREPQDSSDFSEEKSSSSAEDDDDDSLYWVALETFYQSLPMKGIDPELRSFSAYRRGVQEKGDKLQQVDLRLCSEFALMIRSAFGRWPGWERITFPTPGWLPGLQVAALACQRDPFGVEMLRKAIEAFVGLSLEREDPHKPHEGWPGWILSAIARQPGVFATALLDARKDEAMRSH